jgi:hypothetical protein
MSTNIKQFAGRVVVMALAIFTILIFSNVSFAEIGRIHLNKKVKEAIETYKYNPDYEYYFANSENVPCAVIGIQKRYDIGDLLWNKVIPGTDQFKKVIELVKRFPMGSGPAFGGLIEDSQGNTIGEYYSTAGAGVSVNSGTKSIMVTVFMAGKHH